MKKLFYFVFLPMCFILAFHSSPGLRETFHALFISPFEVSDGDPLVGLIIMCVVVFTFIILPIIIILAAFFGGNAAIDTVSNVVSKIFRR